MLRPHPLDATRHRAPALAATLAALATIACGAKDDKSYLDETIASPIQTRALGLEGETFRIDLPDALESRSIRTEQGLPALEIAHPKAKPSDVPVILIEMHPLGVPFPEDEHAARYQLRPHDGRTLEAVERAGAGWVAVTRTSGASPAVHVQGIYEAAKRYRLTCLSGYQGKREDDALRIMQRVCGSLEVTWRRH